jgi:hypothetical protein
VRIGSHPVRRTAPAAQGFIVAPARGLWHASLVTRLRRNRSTGLAFVLWVLAVAIAPAAAAMLGETRCSVECEDDGDEGKCAPGCAECACCPRLCAAAAARPLSTTGSMVVSATPIEPDTVRLPTGSVGRVFRPPRTIASTVS